MRPSRSARVVTWIATILIVAALVALVVIAPVVAAVVFVGLSLAFAIGVGKEGGKLIGVVSFLKDVLFGW